MDNKDKVKKDREFLKISATTETGREVIRECGFAAEVEAMEAAADAAQRAYETADCVAYTAAVEADMGRRSRHEAEAAQDTADRADCLRVLAWQRLGIKYGRTK